MKNLFLNMPLSLLSKMVLLLSTLLGLASPAFGDALTGIWTTDFFDTPLYAAKLENQFEGGIATLRVWSQASLPYQARGFLTERTGRYTVIGPSSEVAGGFDIDIVIGRITLTLLDPDSVQMTTQSGSDEGCGLSNWQLGVAKDVTGLKCGRELFAAAGTVERLVYKIDGSTLFWGPYWGIDAIVPQLPTSVGTRTTKLDRAHPMLRRAR